MCEVGGFHLFIIALPPPSPFLSLSRTGWSVNLDVSSQFCSSATRKASSFDPWSTTHPNTATTSTGWTSRAKSRPPPSLVWPGSSREETVTSVKRGAGSSLRFTQWAQREVTQTRPAIRIVISQEQGEENLLNVPLWGFVVPDCLCSLKAAE